LFPSIGTYRLLISWFLKVFKMNADEKVQLIQSKVDLVQFENPEVISNTNQTKQVNTNSL